MTQLEWKRLEDAVVSMTPEEMERLAALLTRQYAAVSSSSGDPILGLLSGEPELVDQVLEQALSARNTHPLRSGD